MIAEQQTKENRRNQRRDLRKLWGRRNYLANEIAGMFAAGITPSQRIVSEYQLAAMRAYAKEQNLKQNA